MKKCSTCGTLKPLESFAKDNRASGERSARTGKGVASCCKACRSEARKPGITASREEFERLKSEGMKRCTACLQILPNGCFNARKASPDGLMYKCRDCCKAYATEYREKNPECFKDYYYARKDELNQNNKNWREQNPEKNAERLRRWGRENQAVIREKGSRRRAHKLKATPKWADRKKIMEFYYLAERLTEETGVIHHVDHIYPLQSDEVCGLHCEFNLNVITQFENIQKLNHMPSEEYLQRCPR